MRLTTDTFRYASARLPRFNTISISGYHIREAGSTAVQELAFTLANGIAYVQAAIAAGLAGRRLRRRACRSSSTRTTTSSRRSRSSAPRAGCGRAIMRDRFGARDPRTQMLRFHAQTGGSTLTAQQPEVNLVRVAMQALAAVCGGAQSLHTNGFDEALALPTEHSATLALRTQQVLAYEAGTTADRRPARRLVLHRVPDRRARARARAALIDEVDGAAAPWPRSRPASCRPRSRRRRSRTSRRSRAARRSSSASTASGTEAPGRARAAPPRPGARGGGRPSATRALRAGRDAAQAAALLAAVRAAAGGGDARCSSRCAPRSRRAARSARSATCCARSGARTTR